MDANIKSLIVQSAREHKLDPAVVYGVVMTESGGNPFAVRFEPYYRYLYKPAGVRPTGCSVATEETMQKCSIGLMQVMGAVYRERGFRDRWLSELFALPRLQIEYGCQHLAAKIKRYGLERGISAYNAGVPSDHNGEYVRKVLDAMRGWVLDS